MTKTFAVYTLGCKVNSYESDAISALFEEKGLIKVPFSEVADIYVINTCSVTNTGDKKSRQAIRKARRLNPSAFIAVLGCYSQANPTEVKNAGANLICGTHKRQDFVDLALLGKEDFLVEDISKVKEFEELPTLSTSERTRAYIKIQDGCNNFCSYCIIPYTRGRVRSRNVDSIINEAIRLKEMGYKEIVLTGIEVYSYGKDLEGENLISLLRKLSDKLYPIRIRLSSIDPRAFSESFIMELASIRGLCHHFHISAQSGCDETLKRMNRGNTSEGFLESLRLLRHYMSDVAITTDIITGFPGETEEEFNKTREFVNKAKFSRLHVFPYSEREGTPAAKMEQIPVSIRAERAKVLIKDGEALMNEYSASLIGEKLSVLFETGKNGVFEGYSENYVRVFASGKEDLTGEIKTVTAKKVTAKGAVIATVDNE